VTNRISYEVLVNSLKFHSDSIPFETTLGLFMGQDDDRDRSR
jgi:hypothetical protein